MKKTIRFTLAITLAFQGLLETPAHAQLAPLRNFARVTSQPVLVGRNGNFHSKEEWERRDAQIPTATRTVEEGVYERGYYHVDETEYGNLPAVKLGVPDDGPSGIPAPVPVSFQVGFKTDVSSPYQNIGFSSASPQQIQEAINHETANAIAEGMVGALANQKAFENVANAAISSYRNAEDAYGLRANALNQAASQINAQNDANAAGLAAAVGRYTDVQGSVPAGSEQVARAAQAILNDPLVSRKYDLSPLAIQNLDQAMKRALASGQYRMAAHRMEPLTYAPGSPSYPFVNSENVYLFEKNNPAIPQSPLANTKFTTDKNSPQGQVVRRVANEYQAIWAESGGLKNVDDTHRVLFASGLATLHAADREIAKPTEKGLGSGLLVAAWQISQGFVSGFNSRLADPLKGLPELANQAPDLLDAVGSVGVAMMNSATDPEQAFNSAVDLFKSVPGALPQLKLTIAQQMHALGSITAYQAAELAGESIGLTVQALMTVGTPATEASIAMSDSYAAAQAGARMTEVTAPLISLEKAIQVLAAGDPTVQGILESFVRQDAYIVTEDGLKTALAKAGYRLDQQGLERLAAMSHELAPRIAAEAGKAETVTVYRGLDAALVDGLMKNGLSKEEAVFSRHISQVLTPWRLTIGGEMGQGGLYVADSLETITAEMKGATNQIEIASHTFELSKVLDLTDASLLERLKVTDAQLAEVLAANPNAYELPQVIGLLAKKAGFQAIKYGSAARNGGICWVIF